LPSVSLKHLFRQPPEDEKGRTSDQQGAKEQESAPYFLLPVRVVGLKKTRNLTSSKPIGNHRHSRRNAIP
jgi:hypothetical protein